MVSTNTNLGMLLLLAPLAAVAVGVGLEEGIETVLENTTVNDSRAVYPQSGWPSPVVWAMSRIRISRSEPTMRLRDIMRLAADRDLIARQYANGFRGSPGRCPTLAPRLPGLRPGSGNRRRGSLFGTASPGIPIR